MNLKKRIKIWRTPRVLTTGQIKKHKDEEYQFGIVELNTNLYSNTKEFIKSKSCYTSITVSTRRFRGSSAAIKSKKQEMQTYKEIFQARSPFIVIAGIISSGKTTLTKNLSEYLGYTPVYEPVDDNPYLSDFYRDMKTYGFAMQVYLLSRRFELHQQIVWNNKGVIQDRSIYEDFIFAKMLRESSNISELDFQNYISLSHIMCNFLRTPDVIVYLDVKPEVALSRLHERSREAEKGVPLEYLQALELGYKDWLNSQLPVNSLKMIVDYNEYIPTDIMVQKIQEFMEKNNCQKKLVR